MWSSRCRLCTCLRRSHGNIICLNKDYFYDYYRGNDDDYNSVYLRRGRVDVDDVPVEEGPQDAQEEQVHRAQVEQLQLFRKLKG